MKKIIPFICGGIGNQLFCYAAARRLALVNNAELAIDDFSGFACDHVYKRQYQLDHFEITCRKATAAERLEPFARIRRYMLRAINRRRPFLDRSYVQQEGIDFDPRVLQVRIRGTVYLEGYWQSEDYFKDVENTIRADLHIIPPIDSANTAMASRIQNSLAVAVHVRFFDAPDVTGMHNAPGRYYENAITRMEKLVPDAHYFVFSDKPQSARARIPLPDTRVTCVSHNQGDANAYADLWLLTQCQHFITANSTFSWWGAWLGGKKDESIVMSPGAIRGKCTAWGFSGLLPARWQVIEMV